MTARNANYLVADAVQVFSQHFEEKIKESMEGERKEQKETHFVGDAPNTSGDN